jgi:hypothetical protein
MTEKFAIIGGDIHKLVTIKKGEDWAQYAWRIHEEGNKWWVPVPDGKKKGAYEISKNQHFVDAGRED